MTKRYSIFSPNYIMNSLSYRNIESCLEHFKGTLLDIGCGELPYKELIKDKIDYYIGLDFNLNEIQGKFEHKKMFICAKAEELPFKDNSIDTILCTDILEHIPEPDLIMKQIYRVLKPTGYLILSIPQVWYLHCSPHDYYRFTKFGIEYLLQKNKFELINTVKRGNFWLMLAQILNNYIEYSFSSASGKPLTIYALIHKIIKKLKKYVFAFNYYFFSLVDKIDKHNLDTLGYTVVAKKKI